jgi:hypothetical protein
MRQISDISFETLQACRFRVSVSNRPSLSWVSAFGEHGRVGVVCAVGDQNGLWLGVGVWMASSVLSVTVG